MVKVIAGNSFLVFWDMREALKKNLLMQKHLPGMRASEMSLAIPLEWSWLTTSHCPKGSICSPLVHWKIGKKNYDWFNKNEAVKGLKPNIVLSCVHFIFFFSSRFFFPCILTKQCDSQLALESSSDAVSNWYFKPRNSNSNFHISIFSWHINKSLWNAVILWHTASQKWPLPIQILALTLFILLTGKSLDMIRGIKSKVKTKAECIFIIRKVKLCLQDLYYW